MPVTHLLWSLLPTSVLATPVELHCQAVASREGPVPQRIELYTSEGCSSCPPAERWLADLSASPTSAWIPLAFHVDYWDALGWPDRFADPRHASRQRQVARRAGSAVYTPGVFVEGREWRGWRRAGLPSAERQLPAEPLALEVRLHPGARRLRWQWGENPSDRPRWLALVQNGLRTTVRAGENAGAELRHGHVVRWLADARTQAQGEGLYPADLDWRFTALVAWVEQEPGGATVAALRLPLPACQAH